MPRRHTKSYAPERFRIVSNRGDEAPQKRSRNASRRAACKPMSRSSRRPLFSASVPVLLLIGSVITGGVRADESSFYIYEVPYASQKYAYWCGPASLTMVLKYWGLDVTQEEIAAQTYDPEAKLTDISAMRFYPLRYGFRSEELNNRK